MTSRPHSVPLQFLAETGIIGALLAIGGFVLVLLERGEGFLRRLPRRVPSALLAAALLKAERSRTRCTRCMTGIGTSQR